MLNVVSVLGSRLEPAFAVRLHDLAHRGGIDFVTISLADLSRRRLLISTRGGEELAIALPRDQKLFDGAVLFIDNDRAIVVHAATQRWLRLQPHSIRDSIELGYHAGNLHWRVRFQDDVLLVALEGRPEDYLARLGDMVTSGRISVSVIEEEAGGHRHAHDDIQHDHGDQP